MIYFSERYGYVKKVLQIDSIDKRLRNAIYNIIVAHFEKDETVYHDIYLYCWKNKSITPKGYSPGTPGIVSPGMFASTPGHSYDIPYASEFSSWISTCDWYLVYDVVEYILDKEGENKESLKEKLNTALEEEIAMYRIVG